MMMPVLEAEESTTAEIFKIPPSEEDHDQCTPAIPKLEIQQERVATNIFKSAPKTFASPPSSSSRRKYQLFNSDSDLEDEDLQFRGYCYTTIGNDGAKSLNDTYACHYCPAIFDSRVGLTNHAKLHGAEKNMKCEFCDFACTNKKTMRIHRKIHGIIPKRGRQPGTWVQKAMGKSMRKKVKKEEGDEEFGAKMELNNEEEPMENMQKELEVQTRSTRRRITKSGNLCPAAGAVQVEDDRVKEGQEATNERIVIVSKSSRGLEEEEPDSEEDTPKKKKRGGRKKQEQVEGNEAETGAAGTSSSVADKYNLACAICPYRTTQLNYLDQHMLGHSRQSGYVCSVCGFKHEHKRWLNSHCVLHRQKEGLDFQWPPLYVYGEEIAAAMDGQGGGGQQQQKSPIRRR